MVSGLVEASVGILPAGEMDSVASATGRERALRRLGLRGRMPKATFSSRGAWRLAGTGTGTGSVQTALWNQVLRRHGFLMPSDLAAM